MRAPITSAVDCVFGYTGRLFDEDTGLQNNLNRWYDAEVGRWLSEDPIGFEGGDANLYRYVANDPVLLVDPMGQAGLKIKVLQKATPLDDYGRVRSKVKWSVDDPKANGWIIQHVKTVRTVYDATGKVIDTSMTHEYWEAWQVVDGKVYIGAKNAKGTNLHKADTWYFPSGRKGSKGSIDSVSKVKFVPNGDPSKIDPTKWGKIPAAGVLPATSTKPAGWTDEGASDHILKAEWCDVCDPKVKTKITKDVV